MMTVKRILMVECGLSEVAASIKAAIYGAMKDDDKILFQIQKRGNNARISWMNWLPAPMTAEERDARIHEVMKASGLDYVEGKTDYYRKALSFDTLWEVKA
jgi:hypothetical protein